MVTLTCQNCDEPAVVCLVAANFSEGIVRVVDVSYNFTEHREQEVETGRMVTALLCRDHAANR